MASINKKHLIVSLFLVLSAFVSCSKFEQKEDLNELPDEINLRKLQETAFAPTLESRISEHKNIVYAPTLLFAWNEIRRHFKTPIILNDSNSIDFRLLNQSHLYQNTLTESEYKKEVEFDDNQIIARVFFNKTLPFSYKLQKFDDSMVFGGKKVLAFGMTYYDEEIVKFTEIQYYKNDDNFVLKLIPKDKQHEIILAKGIDNVKSLLEAVNKIQNLIKIGNQEQLDSKQATKYSFNENDLFLIPDIRFNIGTNYKNIENQKFGIDGQEFIIETAYQRSGFLLNENGAVVESDADIAAAAVDSVEQVQPKKMIFDKPFFVILKRTNSKNPYFVMKVDNAELLIKKQKN